MTTRPTSSPVATARSAARALASLLFAVALVACTTAPPRKPAHEPSLGERQAAGLRALGFDRGDDGWLLSLPDPISFRFGDSAIDPAIRRVAATTAADLQRLHIRRLRLEGHSDNVGADAVNIEVSERRARAVANVFIEQGFASADVTVAGFGARAPVASNATHEGRARNRRVEIIVPADALAP